MTRVRPMTVAVSVRLARTAQFGTAKSHCSPRGLLIESNRRIAKNTGAHPPSVLCERGVPVSSDSDCCSPVLCPWLPFPRREANAIGTSHSAGQRVNGSTGQRVKRVEHPADARACLSDLRRRSRASGRTEPSITSTQAKAVTLSKHERPCVGEAVVVCPVRPGERPTHAANSARSRVVHARQGRPHRTSRSAAPAVPPEKITAASCRAIVPDIGRPRLQPAGQRADT